METLNRSLAPFGDALWQAIDVAAVARARELLTARRFLAVDGPYGLGLTSVEVGEDDFCRDPEAHEAGAVIARAMAVPMIRRGFRLSLRRVAAFLDQGQPLDLSVVEAAAEAVALREEDICYQGIEDYGVPGLLNATGHVFHAGGDWTSLDQVLTDVLAAITRLDTAGFRGPYALVLEPALYNGLFRRYPQTELLQLEHLRRMCGRGIHKAVINGGALIDPRVGRLLVGQDLAAGYADQDGIHFNLFLSESLVLRIDEPEAVCTLSATPAR